MQTRKTKKKGGNLHCIMTFRRLDNAPLPYINFECNSLQPDIQEEQDIVPSDIDNSDSDHTQEESSLSAACPKLLQMGASDFDLTKASSIPITRLHIDFKEKHSIEEKILVKQASETVSSSEEKIANLDTVSTVLTSDGCIQLQIADHDSIAKPCSSAECPCDTSYQDGQPNGNGDMDINDMAACHSFESIQSESSVIHLEEVHCHLYCESTDTVQKTSDPHHSLNSLSSCAEYQNAPATDAFHAPIMSHNLPDSSSNHAMGTSPQPSALSDISPGKLKRSGTFTKTLTQKAMESDSSCTVSRQNETTCCTSQVQHFFHDNSGEIASGDKETHISHVSNIPPDKVEVLQDSNTSPGNLKRSGTFTRLLINEPPCETASSGDQLDSDMGISIILRQTNEMGTKQPLFAGEHDSQPELFNCEQVVSRSANTILMLNTGEPTLEHTIAAVYKKPRHSSGFVTDQMYCNSSSKGTIEVEKQLECNNALCINSCDLRNKSEHPKCIHSSELTLVFSGTTSNEQAMTESECNGKENSNATYFNKKCPSGIGTFKDRVSNDTGSTVNTMDSSVSISDNAYVCVEQSISPKLRRSGTFSKDTTSVDHGNTHYSSTNMSSCTTEDRAVGGKQELENTNGSFYVPLTSNSLIKTHPLTDLTIASQEALPVLKVPTQELHPL